MKTRVIWLLAAMGLLAVSCMVKEPEQDAMMTDAPRITAMVAAESPATKVSVTESDGEARSTVWDKGDEIAVFIHNAKALEYALEGDGGASSGVFNYVSGFGGAIQFPEVYGVYPYAKGVAFDGSTLQVNFPAAQAYTEGSFDPKANLMVAASRTNDLYFRNVGGYLVLKLWGEDVSVKKIVIKGVAGEPLAGPAAVWASESEAPEIEIAEETAQKAITLTCETPVALGATEDAGTEFWIVVPPTCFEEGLTVTVYGEDGSVFTRTAKGDDTEDGSLSIARKEVYRLGTEVAFQDANGHEYVEMAPGFKVATCNIGAETPEERGDVFKWGETEPSSSLDWDWDTYKWFDATATDWSVYNVDDYGRLTKYMTWMKHTEDDWNTYDWVDTGDYLMRLEPEDDAATVNWGSDWRMPTAAQMEYLTNEDYFTWTKVTREDAEGNEVEGYEVVSQVPGFEGNTIFLPCLVYEDGEVSLFYWTADVSDTYYCNSAYALDDSYGYLDFNDYYYRCNPFPVRPVFGAVPVPELTAFSQDEYVLQEGMYLFLEEPTMLPEYADPDTIDWTSSNESVATVNEYGVVETLSPGTSVITATAHSSGVSVSCTVTVSEELAVFPLGKGWLWDTFSYDNLYRYVGLDLINDKFMIFKAVNSLDELTGFEDSEVIYSRPFISSFMQENGGVGVTFKDGEGTTSYIFYQLTETDAQVVQVSNLDFERGTNYDYSTSEFCYPATVVTQELPYLGGLAITLDGKDYPMWTNENYGVACYDIFMEDLMAGASAATLPLAVLKQSDGSMAYGLSADFTGLDLTGKIAVVSRGQNSFYIKVDGAAEAGASAIIIVNNDPDRVNPNMTGLTSHIPYFIIPQAAYEAILDKTEAEFKIVDTLITEF